MARNLNRATFIMIAIAVLTGCRPRTASKATATVKDNTGAGHPRSSLMLIGGGNYHDHDEQIPKAFVAKIKDLNRGAPMIGIITAASDPGDRKDNGLYYEKFFGDLGAKATWFDLDRAATDSAYSQRLASDIQNMNGFFVGGGDQNNILHVLFDTPISARRPTVILKAMRDAFLKGAVYAGTSAGSAVSVGTNDPMFIAGGNYVARHPQTFNADYDALSPNDTFNYMSIDPHGGLGFFNLGAIDTHFSERSRLLRSFAMGSMLKIGTPGNSQHSQYPAKVFGLDEETVLVVDQVLTDHPIASVLGNGGVSIVDFSGANFSMDSCINAQNVGLSYLTDGDRFDFVTNQVQFAPSKAPVLPMQSINHLMDQSSAAFGSPQDLFSGTEKNPKELAYSVLNGLKGFVQGTSPTLTIHDAANGSSTALVADRSQLKAASVGSGEALQLSWTGMTIGMQCRN